MEDFLDRDGLPLKPNDLYKELFDVELGIFSLLRVENEKSVFVACLWEYIVLLLLLLL